MNYTTENPRGRATNELSLDLDSILQGIELTLNLLHNATTAEDAVVHARTAYHLSQLAPKEFRFRDICHAISVRMPAPTPAQMRYVAYNEGRTQLFVGAALGAYDDKVVYVTKVDRPTDMGLGFVCVIDFLVVKCSADYVFKEAAWDYARPAKRPKLVMSS